MVVIRSWGLMILVSGIACLEILSNLEYRLSSMVIVYAYAL